MCRPARSMRTWRLRRTARCAASALAAWRLLRCHPFAAEDSIRSAPAREAGTASHFSPRTITIERAAPEARPHKRQEVSFARNSQSQSSDAGFRRRWRRRWRLCALITFALRSAARWFCWATSISSSRSRRRACDASSAAAQQQAQQQASLRQLPASRIQRCNSRTANAQSATPTIAASLETETTVENELYKIVFTNRGAQVKHWILKKYNDTAGKPLDMVQPQAAAQFRISALVLHL